MLKKRNTRCPQSAAAQPDPVHGLRGGSAAVPRKDPRPVGPAHQRVGQGLLRRAARDSADPRQRLQWWANSRSLRLKLMQLSNVEFSCQT